MQVIVTSTVAPSSLEIVMMERLSYSSNQQKEQYTILILMEISAIRQYKDKGLILILVLPILILPVPLQNRQLLLPA